MSPLQRIGLTDFVRLLNAWQPRREISEFHLHCTDTRLADFRGLATIEAMRRYHMSKGWSDIAQHLTVDPAGGLWTGRDWDRAPASAAGFNGTAHRGPFMIEVIGRFDKGYDELEGPQREAVISIIVAVLRRFHLKEDGLRFHREFNPGKTCPGNRLDLVKIRREIAPLLVGDPSHPLPRVSDATLAAADVRGWFSGLQSRGAEMTAPSEPEFAEVPEDDWMLFEQEALAARLEADPAARAWRAPLPVDAPLRARTINLHKGVLSTTGDIDSVIVTPKILVEKHLADYLRLQQEKGHPANLVFYAHGGLVTEEQAVCYAKTILPWWEAQEVFPLFFVWETGFFETLRNKARGSRNVVGDAFDWLLQGISRPAVRRIWRRIKDDASNASLPYVATQENRAGGAWQLAQLLGPLLKSYPDTRIHAIGHSTGPILLSRFLPLLIRQGLKIETLSYLAPAIRVDRFLDEVRPTLGNDGVRELCIYTMTDVAEREDTCKGIYRKSLLYFVREACEDERKTPILGLQRDMYASPGVRSLFGLPSKDTGQLRFSNGSVSIEFSPEQDAVPTNPQTAAKEHGAFDNDSLTMISVLSRILGKTPKAVNEKQQFPSTLQFDECGDRDGTRALDDDSDEVSGGCCCRCCRDRAGDATDLDDERDGFGDDTAPEEDSGVEDTPPPYSPPGTGRRVALCIGIDSYRDQPLQGCVADSQRWAEALRREGFNVTHLTNAKATLAALRAALHRLVDDAHPGDELVVQYSGHGASVPNVDGTEGDGRDEALVPVDYGAGHLLADDELHDILGNLAEGATLTLFMDCCHAGSNSRARIQGEGGDDRRPRVMALDQETVARYRALRGTSAHARSRAAPDDDVGPARGIIHFAACQDSEYAWESNGEGDFTRAAMAVFQQARRQNWSNERFMDACVAALGTPRRQRPRLWKPGALASRPLLGA